MLDTGGADVHEGVSALHGWGRIARALCAASGVVPTVLAVRGVCVSGPALLLGLADVVVMTGDAVAYVSGPPSVAAFTGEVLDRDELGGGPVHAVETGVAAVLVDGARRAGSGHRRHPRLPARERIRRPARSPRPTPATGTATVAACDRAGRPRSVPYDVRTVIGDVVDDDSMLELGRDHATNVVTAFARVDGRPVGVVANQPRSRAGTLDIDASRQGGAVRRLV